jgi:cell division protein FtsB
MSLETLARERNGLVSERRGASRALLALALSLYAGFFLYCVLSFLFGPAGLSAYRLLEERKLAMEANLGELGTLRQRLNSELESLKSDPDRAAREARSLGYLRKGETAILLGEQKQRLRPLEMGRVLPYAEPRALGDLVLKEISLGLSLAILALLLAPPVSATRRRSRRLQH